ncbi:response regulator [Pseudomonas sp. SZMC_28357]|uniref:response regulator n=1 Tax=Pseudomonas sp. SZMC_28357 TaxID=3074380 RepID=UPI0028726B94|nr:response regulator [Pseudomonas sp. SZMC_28357]MDR9749998.1 response regulator [Pseudomonas sp. SZMC_28357]
MSNKALRILIADEQHFHRMYIERLFNQLDYFRVAPVTTLAEMLTLIEYASESFDLVVINAAMAGDAFDLQGFFRAHGHVRHALVYGAAQAGLSAAQPGLGSLQSSSLSLPDLSLIRPLMARIDPLLKAPTLHQRCVG